MKPSPFAVIAGVVALVAIGAAVFFGLAVTDHLTAESTPLLSVVFGLIGPAVVSLLTLLRVEQVNHNLQNGLIPSKMKEALQEHDEESGVSELRENLASALENGGISTASHTPEGGSTNG
jgi:hypothetical protein